MFTHSSQLTSGASVRIIRLQNKRELNGVEGTLGTPNGNSRWQVIFGTKSVSVKGDNIEPVGTPKPTLLSEFIQAGKRFQYNLQPPLEHVFNTLWDGFVQTGGVEEEFKDICTNEDRFDCHYGDIIGWS